MTDSSVVAVGTPQSFRQQIARALEVEPEEIGWAQSATVAEELLINAFSAMGEAQLNGARRLIVRTKSIDASIVLIELQDSGTGIAPEKLESIFDPFVTSKRDGLGIGLAISRTIVQRHSGKVWAANNPDRGATFSITLPTSACANPHAAGQNDSQARIATT